MRNPVLKNTWIAIWTVACLLCACKTSAQQKTKEDAEREKLIAASQAGASPLFFDPAAYSNIIDTGTFKNTREYTVRNGLPNFFQKTQTGKPVTIGYIGGSITQAVYCYRAQSARYIQSMFPASSMKGINAGVSGTGTDLGACRLYDQLLQYNPDVVFVEFAVNGAFPDGMEGIIRQIWKYNPAIDICLIYTIYNGQTKAYAAGDVPDNIKGLEKLAEHYKIPSVHMGLEASLLEQEGKLIWKGDAAAAQGRILFSNDGTHPVEAGGNLYAVAIARAMNAMKGNVSVVKHTLPAPVIAGNWEDAGMYAPAAIATFTGGWKNIDTRDAAYLKQFAGWFPYVMKAETPGESFTFRFRGSMFGFFDIGGPEAGQLSVEVDGKPVKVTDRQVRGSYLLVADAEKGSDLVNRFNNFCNNRYRGQYEFIEVPQGEHTVTIKLSDKKADKIAILGEKQLADITANPEKYDKTVLYIGKILLRGEVLK